MNVRILTMTQTRCMARTVEGNRAYVVKAIEAAAASRPDVVCLPEAFTARGVPTRGVADLAETVPGPTTDALAALARLHACYIVCPIYTCRDGRFRNSAVLIDRRGSIAGIYDKARPCLSSADGVFEEGVVAGEGNACFDVDFGRIGIRICMDVNFPEDWRALAEQRVRAVLWPSASDGGLLLQAHAVLNGYFVVSSVRSGKARVVNPCGHVVAETAAGNAFVAADINVEATVVRCDFNTSLAEAIAARYPARVTVQKYSEEGLLLIEPHDGLTAAGLQAELGFELAHESIERHRLAYAQPTDVRIGSIRANPTA